MKNHNEIITQKFALLTRPLQESKRVFVQDYFLQTLEEKDYLPLSEIYVEGSSLVRKCKN